MEPERYEILSNTSLELVPYKSYILLDALETSVNPLLINLLLMACTLHVVFKTIPQLTDAFTVLFTGMAHMGTFIKKVFQVFVWIKKSIQFVYELVWYTTVVCAASGVVFFAYFFRDYIPFITFQLPSTFDPQEWMYSIMRQAQLAYQYAHFWIFQFMKMRI